MYNILVVDDEKIICKGIEKTLSQTGYFNAVSAFNGEEAYKIVLNKDIDAIILDICMPLMDGLTFMEKLREACKLPVIVILSGFDEFEYAQRALKLGALEYILKPLDSDDVLNVAERIKNRLDQRREKQYEYQMLKDAVNKNKQIIKERFFFDLINSGTPDHDFMKRSQFLNLDIPGDYFSVAVIQVEKRFDTADNGLVEEDYQVLLRSVEISLEEYISGIPGCNLFHIRNKYFVIMFCNKKIIDSARLYGFFEVLKKELVLRFNIDIAIGIGNCYKDFNNISRTYNEAMNALNYKLIFGTGAIYSINDFVCYDSSLNIDEHLNRLTLDLKVFNTAEARNKLKELFDLVRSNREKFTPFIVQFYAVKCLSIFISVMIENGVDIANDLKNKANPFVTVFSLDSIDMIEEWLTYILMQTVQKINISYQTRTSTLADDIKKFIDEKYYEEISVVYLSETFNYSPNYLGQVFKSQTGMTVSEYLNYVRIEKAKKFI